MDILIAIAYFTSFFNVWFGVIVFVTMAVYLSRWIDFAGRGGMREGERKRRTR